MKKVLFLSYYFPPVGGVGALRAVKFAKYLPEFGYLPVILTHDSRNDLYIDEDLINELPAGMKIVRAPLQKLVREIVGGTEGASAAAPKTSKLRTFLAAHLYIPDDKIRWKKNAVAAGLKLVAEDKIDVIWSSGAPFSVHLAALALKEKTGKPWIADFRDPWVGHAHLKAPSFVSALKQKFMERRVVKAASYVVSVTDAMTENFRKSYPSLPKEKFVTITNGFDSADFPMLVAPINTSKIPPKNGKINITFLGSVYPATDLRLFFTALGALNSETTGLEDRLTIKLVGYVDEPNRRAIEAGGLSGLVEIKGFLPHKKALEALSAADLLLVSFKGGTNSDVIYTGKVFEYLAAEKPVLALIPDGSLKDLLIKLKAGFVVKYNDTDGILTFMRKLLENELDLKLGYGRKDIKAFDRKELTGQLAALMEKIS